MGTERRFPFVSPGIGVEHRGQWGAWGRSIEILKRFRGVSQNILQDAPGDGAPESSTGIGNGAWFPGTENGDGALPIFPSESLICNVLLRCRGI